MGRKQRVSFLMVLFLLTVLYEPVICSRASYAAAARNVKTSKELEQALRASGELTINMKADITVSKCLTVRGNKLLHGGGTYRIRRKTAADSTYKGTLLQMQGSCLRLKDITVSGSGKSSTASGDINGKLIEIDAGSVVLESGAKLVSNYNVSSFTDGGGGITVHAGGTAVMKPGSVIRDHLTLTGGSGVRVEAGGMFIMEGGSIADNAVLGQSKASDFDGRGGAIHNRGVVRIEGGTISGNVAAGYVKGSESHGGYGGAIYNMGVLTISGGRIEKNKGAFAGGAIYTNAESVVNMDGGEISANMSPGQRGGGIYVSAAAVVNVNGGSIRDNVAEDGTQLFIASHAVGKVSIKGGTVSGSGDVIYNNGGNLSVSGGTVKSRDCAVKSKGNCEIRGGTVRGDEYGVRYGAGTLTVSGKPGLNSVYLSGDLMVRVDQKIGLDVPCELCPETYKDGKKLVHISSGELPQAVLTSFSLRKKKRFLLETGQEGLYIGREKYRIVFEANGGQGNMEEQQAYVGEKTPLKPCGFWREGYGFAGWAETPAIVKSPKEIPYRDGTEVQNLRENGETVHLYALWVKKPVLTSKFGGVVFYEGEYVDRHILLSGMQASDECDGDLTEKIEIVKVSLPDKSELASFDTLPTKESDIGKGEILYQVKNSFGILSEYRQTYEVIPNAAPELAIWDRYYFVDEYAEECLEQAKQDILSHMRIRDDVETKQQLEKNMTVLWGRLDFQTEGEYPVTVRIKDQYGHRFYMEDGEERQYGTGKTCEKKITVHVVKGENDRAQSGQSGFVRFITEEYSETLDADSVWRTGDYAAQLAHTFRQDCENSGEVWTVTAEDKKKIKKFLRERDDPFSRQTNQLFMQQFSYMKIERDGVK